LTELETPLDVVRELGRIRATSERGIELLAEAERNLVALELAADRVEALALLDAQGTVVDRQAVAKLAAADAREEASMAKVEVNRIRLKLKHLTESMMAVQTSARMIELQWKTS
jgi:hypothetical protein